MPTVFYTAVGIVPALLCGFSLRHIVTGLVVYFVLCPLLLAIAMTVYVHYFSDQVGLSFTRLAKDVIRLMTSAGIDPAQYPRAAIALDKRRRARILGPRSAQRNAE